MVNKHIDFHSNSNENNNENFILEDEQPRSRKLSLTTAYKRNDFEKERRNEGEYDWQ